MIDIKTIIDISAKLGYFINSQTLELYERISPKYEVEGIGIDINVDGISDIKHYFTPINKNITIAQALEYSEFLGNSLYSDRITSNKNLKVLGVSFLKYLSSQCINTKERIVFRSCATNNVSTQECMNDVVELSGFESKAKQISEIADLVKKHLLTNRYPFHLAGITYDALQKTIEDLKVYFLTRTFNHESDFLGENRGDLNFLLLRELVNYFSLKNDIDFYINTFNLFSKLNMELDCFGINYYKTKTVCKCYYLVPSKTDNNLMTLIQKAMQINLTSGNIFGDSFQSIKHIINSGFTLKCLGIAGETSRFLGIKLYFKPRQTFEVE